MQGFRISFLFLLYSPFPKWTNTWKKGSPMCSGWGRERPHGCWGICGVRGQGGRRWEAAGGHHLLWEGQAQSSPKFKKRIPKWLLITEALIKTPGLISEEAIIFRGALSPGLVIGCAGEDGRWGRQGSHGNFILRIFNCCLDAFPNTLSFATATAQNFTFFFILSLICLCLLLIIKRQ